MRPRRSIILTQSDLALRRALGVLEAALEGLGEIDDVGARLGLVVLSIGVGPVGLGRFSTLRSWLSQWCLEYSNAKGPMNAAKIRNVPVLQIENEADDAVPASHNPIIHAALATKDKEMISIEGATHYYLGQPQQLAICIDAVMSWSRRKGLLD